MGHSNLLSFNMPPISKGGLLGVLSGAGGGGGSANNWYSEITRKTLDGSASQVQTSEFTPTENLMFLASFEGDNTNDPFLEFNDEAGSLYSNIYSRNGSVSSDTNQGLGLRLAQGTTDPMFSYGWIENISDEIKLVQGWTVEENGTGNTAPDCQQFMGKFDKTDEQINQLALTRASGNFEDTSEIVALGTDYSGQSNDNFWEKIAEDKTSGSEQYLEVTGLTEKKYYFVQYYYQGTTDMKVRFSSGGSFDDGNNYNQRFVYNGTFDTGTGRDNIELTSGSKSFTTMFILNIDGKPKILVNDSSLQNIANTQNDKITFGKWTETDSLDGIRVFADGHTFTDNSIMTVWGHD